MLDTGVDYHRSFSYITTMNREGTGVSLMIGEYEIYADERYHARRYLMIGGIICTDKGREQLHERLIQVRKYFSLDQRDTLDEGINPVS